MQTGGFEAQYGEALGGIVNVVTKSGTNQFHGDVFGYFQPQQFEATRTNANPLLVSKTDYLVHQASIDYGADAGGYILKDKLFWYGGFNPLINGTLQGSGPVLRELRPGRDRPQAHHLRLHRQDRLQSRHQASI